MSIRPVRFVVAALLVALCAGVAVHIHAGRVIARGTLVTDRQLCELRLYESTRAQVSQFLGAPDAFVRQASGKEVVSYHFEEVQRGRVVREERVDLTFSRQGVLSAVGRSGPSGAFAPACIQQQETDALLGRAREPRRVTTRRN